MQVYSKPLPSLDRIRELFTYSPESGEFYRVVARAQNATTGSIAGSLDPSGYIRIYVDGTPYQAHRLAWLYSYGEDPQGFYINHINSNRSDNRIDNLEAVTSRSNCRHAAEIGIGSNGLPAGVHWKKSRQKYVASIYANGIRYGLGSYDTSELAATAYRSVANDIDFIANVTSNIQGWIVYRVHKATGTQPRPRALRELPPGVYASGGRYIAKVKRKNKSQHLGTFDTPEEASAAYIKAKLEGQGDG